jgi:hypothetical protein
MGSIKYEGKGSQELSGVNGGDVDRFGGSLEVLLLFGSLNLQFFLKLYLFLELRNFISF